MLQTKLITVRYSPASIEVSLYKFPLQKKENFMKAKLTSFAKLFPYTSN